MPELMDQASDLINEFENKADDKTEEESEEELDEEEKEETEEESETEETESDSEADDDSEDSEETEQEAEADDDYVEKTEDEEKPVKTLEEQPQLTDVNKYILEGLTKLPVNIIVPGPDGKDMVKQVEVYGYGDLPADFKGYANPLEAERFRGAVVNQELEARRLKSEFQQKQIEKQTNDFVTKENRAIGRDLQSLRKAGVFPKFVGDPGSKEFNNSAGAKEFDRVLAFMKEQNEQYAADATKGEAYYHIGFAQAFRMLNGDVKGRETAEGKARRTLAARTKSRKGSPSKEARKVSTKVVTNLMDLADEFQPTAN